MERSNCDRLPSSAFNSAMLALAVLGIPAIAACLFAYLFTTPISITDEWHFVEALIRMEGAKSWSSFFSNYVTDHHGHSVPVTFAIWWVIQSLTSFDSRSLILFTIATYAVQVFIFYKIVGRSILATLPIAILYFSPSHYFDFLWSFTFTLATATFFVVMGLAVINSATSPKRLVPAFLFFQLAVNSSANGLFGFVSGAFLVAVRSDISGRKRTFIVAALLLLCAANYVLFLHSALPLRLNVSTFLGTLTGFGAAVLDSPWAIRQFSIDTYSIVGCGIVSGGLLGGIVAWRRGMFRLIALPFSIFLYSGMAFGSVMVARGEFGGWQLQLAVPGIAGAFATIYLLARESSASKEASAFYSLFLFASLIGYWTGFTNRGPHWGAYSNAIWQYAKTYEANPTQKPPHISGPYSINENLLNFWKRKGVI